MALQCELCEEVEAAWVIDREITFGGHHGSPAHDELVYYAVCEACKARSTNMEPELLTLEWLNRLL